MIRKDFESFTIVRSFMSFLHENVWSSSIKVTERKERTWNEANGRKRRVNLNLYDFRKVVYISTLCLIFVGWMQIIILPSLPASSELPFCFDFLKKVLTKLWARSSFPSFIFFGGNYFPFYFLNFNFTVYS